MVEPRWVLHVGNHKTGTSALQYLLWRNRRRMRRRGVLYPETGLEAGVSHGPLAEGCKPVFHDPSAAAATRAALLAEVAGSRAHTVVLSSEVFLEHPRTAAVVRDWLPAHADVTILVYLRNQADWLQSVMDEVVRNPYRRFTGDLRDLREYRNRHHDYATLLEPWVEAFGAHRLLLRSYDAIRGGAGLFPDLLDILGLPPRGWHTDIADAHRNGRLPALATEFLRRVNRTPMRNDERAEVVAAVAGRAETIAALAPACSLIDREFQDALVAECAKANEALFARLPPHQPTTLFEDFDAGRAPLPSAAGLLTAQRQEQVLAALPARPAALIRSAAHRMAPNRTGTALPPAPRCREDRLNEIVMRQRMELRELYALLEKRTRP